MNRILEIDQKNMYIVVEPYVSFAQVQAEVHKVGLNCNILGAGGEYSGAGTLHHRDFILSYQGFPNIPAHVWEKTWLGRDCPDPQERIIYVKAATGGLNYRPEAYEI